RSVHTPHYGHPPLVRPRWHPQPQDPALQQTGQQPQSGRGRIAPGDKRLMTAAAKAAAITATSAAVASMAKRLGRGPKRATAAAATGADAPQAKRGRSAGEAVQPDGGPVGPMTCVNCGTTKTPLWRRDPRGQPICNACGLYLKSYGRMRPLTLKRTQRQAEQQQGPQHQQRAGGGGGCSHGRGDEGTCPGNGTCNGKGGRPACDGCPAYNQKHLPHTTRPIGVTVNGSVRRLTAAERAAAIANGAATDEQGNIVGPIPDSAIGPGRIPQHIADAIAQATVATAAAPSGTPPPGVGEVLRPGGAPAEAGEHAVCFNCGTDYTPLWRRDADGHITCNACGLYYKLHGRHRPTSMKRDAIKRRRRQPQQPQPPTQPPRPLPPHAPSDDDDRRGEDRSPSRGSTDDDAMRTLVEAASARPPLPTDPADVARCREELQRECARLQSLLQRSTTLLESLDKAAPPPHAGAEAGNTEDGGGR
ncbi:GATA type transcriptional activator of nitrogen-regulated proteins, partial [Coemansia nantahalensis]